MAALLLILVAVFVGLLALLLPTVLTAARQRWVLRKMPGRAQMPIIGHAHYYLGKKPHEIVAAVWKAFEECGNTWKMFLLHEVQVVTSDPKVCEVSAVDPPVF